MNQANYIASDIYAASTKSRARCHHYSSACRRAQLKCEADVSLLAHIVVAKFVDHLPEYRQQQIFKREGVIIAPSTMNGWGTPTQPLYEAYG
ncbi:MAG: transposase [Saprospiraceae bacterium]|nr:transposase [Candidatus Vicinibacter affinis]